jgi:hypothetical protein
VSQASPARKVDQTGLKTGQAVTILLLLAAFVLNSPLLVAVVAICQLLGALDLALAPYRLLYKGVLLPVGLLQPRIVVDNPEPHRFAMLVGAIFNGAAVAFLALGLPVVAWVLVWVVIALANLNFWLNFCLGCWMYYQLRRLGVPGFTAAPLSE